MRAPLLLLSLFCACSPSAAAPLLDARVPLPVAESVKPAPEPAASVLEAVSPVAPSPSVQRRASRVSAPKNGCALRADQTLTTAEHALALQLDGLPAVLTLGPGSLTLWLGRADGTFVRGPERPLESKVSHASAACVAARCELALVDERARLLSSSAEPSSLAAPTELASGLDRRFAPALAVDGRHVHYAFTRSVDEAMHTFWIAQSGGVQSEAKDLTPAGHGAAAATFILGTERPTLVFIDAHAGISPLLELTFNRSGQPSESVVRTPVSQPYAPPLLSAVQWPSGQAEVFFSAVGRLAKTAIARVPLRKAADPSALAPSQGYGALAFAGALSSRRALYALETPTASTPAAPRTLSLKLIDGTRSDDVHSFPADSRRPSIAAGAAAGEYLLTYTREQQVHAVLLSCDD